MRSKLTPIHDLVQNTERKIDILGKFLLIITKHLQTNYNGLYQNFRFDSTIIY